MKLLEKIAVIIHKVTRPWIFALFCIAILSLFIYLDLISEAKLFILSGLATLLIVLFLKKVTQTPRPSNAKVQAIGTGFPSAHAASALFIATIFYYFLHQWEIRNADIYSDLLFVLAFLVGISRLIIRVHTFSQVLTGFVIGIVIPIFLTLFF
ncbi:phosphatase PAP2 family protein [Candidatus Nomurabacteria bacterium]|nr:phosphatase PAP2 family protein [Candidatus Nomurabacteria bacterium]